jgi:hypothetical protein
LSSRRRIFPSSRRNAEAKKFFLCFRAFVQDGYAIAERAQMPRRASKVPQVFRRKGPAKRKTLEAHGSQPKDQGFVKKKISLKAAEPAKAFLAKRSQEGAPWALSRVFGCRGEALIVWEALASF